MEMVELRTLIPMDEKPSLILFAGPDAWLSCTKPRKTAALPARRDGCGDERSLDSLKAPLRRVADPDIYVPAGPPLERFYIPKEERLVSAVKEKAG